MLKVSLIIPAYNEAECIGAVLEEVLALPPNPAYSLEVMVVDGNSRDSTAQIALSKGVKVVQQVGKGYGAACFTGFNNAEIADILVYLDGDYSDPPAAVPALLDKMLSENADLVLGTRYAALMEPGALPAHAIWGNRLVTSIVNLLYHQKYNDLPSLKAIRRDKLETFEMQEMTYGWTTEMLVKAARSRCKVAEVPVSYRRRLGGKSKVSGTIRGTLGAAYHLLKTAWHYRHWQPAESYPTPGSVKAGF